MTGDFAVVAEGFTDQIVIKNIILAHFAENDDEPVVNFEQPQLDATSAGAQPQPGGWTLVQKYFEARKYLQALQINKYLVIHIDTDIATDLGITLVVAGRQLEPQELVEAVISYFQARIDPEVLKIHGSRFLFAIAVNSIECWLLPLVFDQSQKTNRRKQSGCLRAIDHKRKKSNQNPLSSGQSKDPLVYREISDGFRDREVVKSAAGNNPGFKRFVEQLETTTLP